LWDSRVNNNHFLKKKTIKFIYKLIKSYMPPEMINKKPYDFKIDIWGLGILLYELTHGFFFHIKCS
jgi:serine/threonine protein kinase